LSAALNSPISAYAAEAIGNALNYLLASGIYSLRIGKAVYVFWTRAGATVLVGTSLRIPGRRMSRRC